MSGKGSDWDRVDNLTSLPHKILEAASKAGIDETEKERSASYLHLDHSLVVSKVNEEFKGQIELMDTLEALEKYDWLSDLRFSLVDKDKDEYTKVAQNPSGGYFIRILPGAKVTFPLQSCLMITQNGVEQKVHNIIICEEGS
ncbi:MAG: SufD family Fe-S cluster assembly protein, partial [Methanobacteriota archaeon]